MLVRFTDILRHRVGQLHSAFANAIRIMITRGRYRCVYPIKVNQQKHVVEEIKRVRQAVWLWAGGGQQAELLAVWRCGRRQDGRSSATGSRMTSSSRR